jgi:aminomethyltransferase
LSLEAASTLPRMPETLHQTPLHAEHVALGGRMVPFAGYEMPVQYTGVIAESKAVRESAGMFDVSHMARLWIRGEGALGYLEWVTTNDVAKLEDGRGQYSLLPNERGGVVDDVIVYRIAQDAFRMVVNASNHEKDVAWLEAQNSHSATIEDETARTAMIAVQGPRAAEILKNLSDHPHQIESAPLFGVVETSIGGVPCFAPRSGYTGEDGFELVCMANAAVALWQTLLEAGVTPCGLGARDVLRVEAGLPLYGHELSDERSPLDAGLGWVIGKEKRFVGSETIQKVRAEGSAEKLVGIVLQAKRLLAPGMEVRVEGKRVGEVSSGVFSPTLDRSIAFAFVERGVPLETSCEVDVRGKLEPGKIVGKRFLKDK